MFDKVRNSKRFTQIVLAIIIVPFALFGIDAYINPSMRDSVATVGDLAISQGEFQEALREQQDRLRPQLGNVDPALLDSPEIRRGVLDELINQRLLLLHARESNVSISNAALAEAIMSVPALQENGRFSRERYEALIAAQGMRVEDFEAQVRQDMIVQQMMLPVGNAALGGRLSSERWIAAQIEEREVAEVVLHAEQFLAGIQPDAAAIERYYQENRAMFENPEQVRVEYLLMSQDAYLAQVRVPEAEIEAWYRANKARYTSPEERQASHILIRADMGAPEAEVKAAQDKAADLLRQVRATPADFARLAREHSQDPGSAARGGDLGHFGRGMMVKPFEDAVYALKEGEISDVVRSDFGFHIIHLTGIRAEQVQPLAAVRDEIAAELGRQMAARQYAEKAESFSNTVYEQYDSLQPAVEKYGLTLQVSDWLVRGAPAAAPFSNARLLQAVFSEDAIRNRRNTEAIDVGGNTLVAARVAEHRPAQLEPLAAVAGTISQLLAREAAVTRAAEAGASRLARLNDGEKTDLRWGAARSVSRLHAPNMTDDAVRAIFAAPAGKLPAYVGVRIADGYALYRIDKVKPYDAADEQMARRGQALRHHYDEVVAQQELLGWLAALRQRYGVNIDSAALERK